jgi:hypothetical protein
MQTEVKRVWPHELALQLIEQQLAEKRATAWAERMERCCPTGHGSLKEWFAHIVLGPDVHAAELAQAACCE